MFNYPTTVEKEEVEFELILLEENKLTWKKNVFTQ